MLDIHTHNLSANNAIINLYENFDALENQKLYSIGLHPWYVKDNESIWQAFLKSSGHKNVVAIGECGLDKLANTDWQLQTKMFTHQITLANQLQKPLIIHCVKAWSECLFLLKKATVPVLFHGFNNAEQIAQSIVDRGFYLSFGKSLQKESIIKVLKTIPINKVFFETDDSSLSISEIYKMAASVLNIELNTLILQIQKNAFDFFGKDL